MLRPSPPARTVVAILCALAFTALLGGIAAPPARAANGFDPLPNALIHARADHTATVLKDGRVLLVGGLSERNTPTATAEIYDPATRTFAATGSLYKPRYMHGAALLPNGDVLIAGGRTTNQYDALKLEIYETDKGTFTSLDATLPPLLLPNVVTLQDPADRVLIAGGYNFNLNAPTTIALLYDPGNRTVTSTANQLAQGRFRHATVRQDDGKVLLAGGVGAGGALDSAELYDPATSSFSLLAARLSTPRSDIAAALLRDGRVLLAGGETAPAAETNVAEIYDPINDRFVATGAMPAIRSQAATARLDDGRVLIAGGFFQGSKTETAVLYNPANNSFATTGPLSGPRAGHTATTLGNGQVLAAGGSAGGALNIAELYTPERVDAVTIRPAAPSAVSSTEPNITVNIAATGTAGMTDRVTITLTDAAGDTQTATADLTIPASGPAAGSVTFAVATLGTATIAATATSGATIAPSSVLIQPTGFALDVPPTTFRSGVEQSVRLTAQAAGAAQTRFYRGTPMLSSAGQSGTADPRFGGSCPAFTGATQTCVVEFGDLGRRAFAASDGGASTFGPFPVLPHSFRFGATDSGGAAVNLAAYRSGTSITLTVTALAKPGASIADYDGADFGVRLESNDRTPHARAGVPSGGVATFDNVTFVKLGGQAGSPFSPRFTATDSQRADSTGALALTVGPAAIAITAPTAPVRAGESFSLTVTIDALGGAPEDRRDYAGSVTFAAPDDPTADLPTPLAFTAQNRGVRTASLTLRSPGAQTVRVQDETNGVSGSFSLTVLPAAPPDRLKITPLHLDFRATAGDSAPPAQAITIDHPSGEPHAWNATALLNGLILSETSGTTPATVTVSVNTAGMPAGSYSGSILVRLADGSIDPQSVGVTLTITAPTNHTLTLVSDPPGTGTILLSGNSLPPGNSFPPGTLISLTAQPAAGYILQGWIVDGSPAATTNPLPLTVNADHLVTARFVPAPPPPTPSPTPTPRPTPTPTPTPAAYNLTLSAAPGGAVAASRPGPYRQGTTVRLTATPDKGYGFAGWRVDGADAGAENPLTLTMAADRTVVALFAPLPPVPPTATDCGVWSCWDSLGGTLTDAPASVGFNGRVYVFARGTDEALYVQSAAVGGTFTGWKRLGGTLTAAPAATSVNGRLYVFAKGSDDALYVMSSSDGGIFSDWRPLGGILTGPPTAAGLDGTLYVFARGTDEALYVKRATNGRDFDEWRSLGGILTGPPAAAGFRGRVHVFARGSDDALYEISAANDGDFTGWDSLGGRLTSGPAAATNRTAGGRESLHVFARGRGDALFERHTSGGVWYTGWVSLGGPIDGPPAAASVGGRLFVFARGQDDALWERRRPR